MATVSQDAHAVQLPVIWDLVVTRDVRALFESGCVSILPLETAPEYEACAMSPERIALETPEMVRGLADTLASIAGGRVTFAVDEELAGIERLHNMVPRLPSKEEVADIGPAGVEAATERVARAMRELGVTWTLAPTLEVVRGVNPWLAKRHLGPDPEYVTKMTLAFIRGMAKGGVVSTAKHFPGCGDAAADPHYGEVHITSSREDFEKVHLPPFKAAIQAGVGTIMTGPATIDCYDAVNPVSVSKSILQGLLREELGFKGLITSVDMDAPATAMGFPVPQRGVEAIAAGCDLLLIGTPDVALATAVAIEAAVDSGQLSRERLAEAADRARKLAAGAYVSI